MIYQQTDFAGCNSDRDDTVIQSHPVGFELIRKTDKDQTGLKSNTLLQ